MVRVHLTMRLAFKLSIILFFRNKYEKLRSAFDAMTKACKNVLHHPGLRDFLGLVLKAGNFLNNVREISGFSFQALSEIVQCPYLCSIYSRCCHGSKHSWQIINSINRSFFVLEFTLL